MDRDWMRARLENYLALCERIADHQRANGYEWDEICRDLNDRATVEIPTVGRILRILDPSWAGTLMPPSYTSSDGAMLVRQALGSLRDMAEWRIRLAPEAPSIAADQMHSLIWSAASTVWSTGEFKTAVQQAAVALSAHIKAAARSSLNERKLVQNVFSPDLPRQGSARLHLPGDHDDETWRSRQQGLHLIAQGAFAGIRNVAAHDDETWSEQEALERLAVLSLVAQWTDATVLSEWQERDLA